MTGVLDGAPALAELWTADDVAKYLRVSRSWVYQHAEAGTIPVIRFPGSSLLRFDPDKIRAYARGEWLPPKVKPLLPSAGKSRPSSCVTMCSDGTKRGAEPSSPSGDQEGPSGRSA